MAQLEKRYEEYLRDESRLTGYAESILQAKSAQEVLDFLKTESPFTVQGARTGIVGGAVPQGGRILNLSSMNRITGLSVKDGAFFVTVEPGVLLCDLDDALASKRFDASSWDEPSREALAALAKAPPQFFPPDPTESTATLGGMFAANARRHLRLPLRLYGRLCPGRHRSPWPTAGCGPLSGDNMSLMRAAAPSRTAPSHSICRRAPLCAPLSSPVRAAT